MRRCIIPLILLIIPLASISASERPVVGAIRWDAWHTPTGNNPAVAMIASLGPRQYHYRLPFFANVAGENDITLGGYTQDILDREIGFAKAGGLGYWAFLLYETNSAMSDALGFYLSSSRKQDMPFCIIATPNTFGNKAQFRERMKRMVTLMTEPSYQCVQNGRPLMYLFDVRDAWIPSWGGETNTRALFDEFRSAVKAAGRGDPYITVMDFNAPHGKKIADITGSQAISTYAKSGPMNGATPYQMLAKHAADFWEQCALTGMDVVPIVMAGWDRRPRIEHPVPWEKNQKPGVGIEHFYVMPTPQELAAHIQDAIQWCVDNQTSAGAQTVIVYAWNEHDEGGYLCPTLNDDGSANTGRLSAIAGMLSSFADLPTKTSGELPCEGMLLRLDADDAARIVMENGSITQWNDSSERGNDAVAADSRVNPVSLPGGRRALRFNGGYFRIPSIKAEGTVTAVTVTRRTAGQPTGKFGRIVSFYDGSTSTNNAPADWMAPSWCVTVLDEKPYDMNCRIITAGKIDGLTVGANASRNGDVFYGDIAEIIVYDRALSTDEERSIRIAMRKKWMH
ncbi:MAG: hypothetical protein HZC28_17085 [Spirochaetes bacterium]|nr:hypothetical protein [Spirochaetota bacterium]